MAEEYLSIRCPNRPYSDPERAHYECGALLGGPEVTILSAVREFTGIWRCPWCKIFWRVRYKDGTLNFERINQEDRIPFKRLTKLFAAVIIRGRKIWKGNLHD
jgi:hypothetical protein